jgi:cobalt-zinc-cadmium efflux system outer membrane protein
VRTKATRRLIYGATALLLLLSPSVTAAGEGALKTATVQDLVDEALRANPLLSAAKAELGAARAAVGPATILPNPVLGVGYGMIPEDEFGLGNAEMRSVSVTQRLPFPPKLYYQNRKAAHTGGLALAMYRMKEREIVRRVKETYYELFSIHESIRITEESRVLVAGFERVAEARYAVGTESAGDVLKAQVELAKLENDLVNLKTRLVTAEAQMVSLLNRPQGEVPGIPESPNVRPLTLTLEEVYSLALENRPQLLAAEEMTRIASANHGTSRMSFFPDLMVSVKHEDREMGTDTWEVMFSAELPLWVLFKENGRLRETGARLAGARSELEDESNETRLAIESAYAAYEAARRILELFDTGILPQAEMSLESTQTAYENGTQSFLSLLDSERNLLGLKLQYARAQSDFEKTIAMLEMVAGSDLPRAEGG